MPMNIVLVQPEIPHNTGNVARTCALTKTRLHLVKPLGFSIDDKHLKRAGLDYWNLVDVTLYDSFNEVIEKNKNADLIVLNTLEDKDAGFKVETNKVTFITADKEPIEFPVKSKTEVAKDILNFIAQNFIKNA